MLAASERRTSPGRASSVAIPIVREYSVSYQRMPAAQAAAETGDSRLSGLDWDLVRVGRQAGLAVLFPAMRQGRQAMRFRHEVTWFLDEAIDMLDRAERLQRQFFHPPQFGQPRASWAPPVDMFAQGDALIVLVALPDVSPACVEVLHEGSTLTVRGLRPLPAACRRAEILRLEIPYGRFERHIELPRERFAAPRTEFLDGCLVITLERQRGGTP